MLCLYIKGLLATLICTFSSELSSIFCFSYFLYEPHRVCFAVIVYYKSPGAMLRSLHCMVVLLLWPPLSRYLNTAAHKIKSGFVKMKFYHLWQLICLHARRQDSSLSSKGRREKQSWLPLCSQKMSKGYVLEERFRSQF